MLWLAIGKTVEREAYAKVTRESVVTRKPALKCSCPIHPSPASFPYSIAILMTLFVFKFFGLLVLPWGWFVLISAVLNWSPGDRPYRHQTNSSTSLQTSCSFNLFELWWKTVWGWEKSRRISWRRPTAPPDVLTSTFDVFRMCTCVHKTITKKNRVVSNWRHICPK